MEAELRHGSTPFWGSKNCCAVLLIFGVLINPSESQGPDLNRDVADLQSAAWPLRHLGNLLSFFSKVGSAFLLFLKVLMNLSEIHDCESYHIK